eukprot:GILK01012614.1.p1 GENE.GILK01012614.1~~GILK01012614.1.p1  ORF type:complete len:1132 (-),score=289.02 GILK01012614.1:43-3438(-)
MSARHLDNTGRLSPRHRLGMGPKWSDSLAAIVKQTEGNLQNFGKSKSATSLRPTTAPPSLSPPKPNLLETSFGAEADGPTEAWAYTNGFNSSRYVEDSSFAARPSAPIPSFSASAYAGDDLSAQFHNLRVGYHKLLEDIKFELSSHVAVADTKLETFKTVLKEEIQAEENNQKRAITQIEANINDTLAKERQWLTESAEQLASVKQSIGNLQKEQSSIYRQLDDLSTKEQMIATVEKAKRELDVSYGRRLTFLENETRNQQIETTRALVATRNEIQKDFDGRLNAVEGRMVSQTEFMALTASMDDKMKDAIRNDSNMKRLAEIVDSVVNRIEAQEARNKRLGLDFSEMINGVNSRISNLDSKISHIDWSADLDRLRLSIEEDVLVRTTGLERAIRESLRMVDESTQLRTTQLETRIGELNLAASDTKNRVRVSQEEMERKYMFLETELQSALKRNDELFNRHTQMESRVKECEEEAMRQSVSNKQMILKLGNELLREQENRKAVEKLAQRLQETLDTVTLQQERMRSVMEKNDREQRGMIEQLSHQLSSHQSRIDDESRRSMEFQTQAMRFQNDTTTKLLRELANRNVTTTSLDASQAFTNSYSTTNNALNDSLALLTTRSIDVNTSSLSVSSPRMVSGDISMSNASFMTTSPDQQRTGAGSRHIGSTGRVMSDSLSPRNNRDMMINNSNSYNVRSAHAVFEDDGDEGRVEPISGLNRLVKDSPTAPPPLLSKSGGTGSAAGSKDSIFTMPFDKHSVTGSPVNQVVGKMDQSPNSFVKTVTTTSQSQQQQPSSSPVLGTMLPASSREVNVSRKESTAVDSTVMSERLNLASTQSTHIEPSGEPIPSSSSSSIIRKDREQVSNKRYANVEITPTKTVENDASFATANAAVGVSASTFLPAPTVERLQEPLSDHVKGRLSYDEEEEEEEHAAEKEEDEHTTDSQEDEPVKRPVKKPVERPLEKPVKKPIKKPACNGVSTVLGSGGGVQEIEIVDCPWNVFRLVLEYMYKGTLRIDNSNALDVLVAADRYGVRKLRDECIHRLTESLTANNVVKILLRDNLKNVDQLVQTCIQFARQNFAVVTGLSEFMELCKLRPDVMVRICSNCDLIPAQTVNERPPKRQRIEDPSSVMLID